MHIQTSQYQVRVSADNESSVAWCPMLAFYVSVSIATNDVSTYNNQWFYSVFCFHIVNMDLLYHWRDVTQLNVFCIMLLLVVLVEPHYEINLLCKVYNAREIDCERASTHGDHYAYGCSQQGQGNLYFCITIMLLVLLNIFWNCVMSLTSSIFTNQMTTKR